MSVSVVLCKSPCVCVCVCMGLYVCLCLCPVYVRACFCVRACFFLCPLSVSTPLPPLSVHENGRVEGHVHARLYSFMREPVWAGVWKEV